MKSEPIKSRRPWTQEETIALIATYQRMYELQIANKLGPAKSKGQTSKAELVRQFIQEHAPDRQKQSVEMKLMNISAARQEAGLPIVNGYKALPNGANLLIELIGGGGQG